MMESLEDVWKKMSLAAEEEEEEVDGVRSRPSTTSGDEDEKQALPFIKLTSKSLNYEAMKSTLMKLCIGERHKGMKFKERVVINI